MDAKTAKKNLVRLDWIRDDVVRLRNAEEGAALKGDVDDLLLPIAAIRKLMSDRLAVLTERT